MPSFNKRDQDILTRLMLQVIPPPAELHEKFALSCEGYLQRYAANSNWHDLWLFRSGCEIICRAEAGGHLDIGERTLSRLAAGTIDGWSPEAQAGFATAVQQLAHEALLSDPFHGGNVELCGWQFLDYPGMPLREVSEHLPTGDWPPEFDPMGWDKPERDCDAVIVGVGGVGGLVVERLTAAGLDVTAIEAGPWFRGSDFIHDELEVAYWARAAYGNKFLRELPTWWSSDWEGARPTTASLGLMVNGVGGSIHHWGAWLRRFHPHHFQRRSHLSDSAGEMSALLESSTLVDWPISYEDLEPHYSELEKKLRMSGTCSSISGATYPNPPFAMSHVSELFVRAALKSGWSPYPVPVGADSTHPALATDKASQTLSAGFGDRYGVRWAPTHSSVPNALRTGKLDLRTHCRVTSVLTESSGRAIGVEYLDPLGRRRKQKARRVILAAYTFETTRLLFISGDTQRPNGLGNNAGQLGRHLMMKNWPRSIGRFSDDLRRNEYSTSHSYLVDHFLDASFDSTPHGFVGSATIGVADQATPLAIGQEALPGDMPRWGDNYAEHLKGWRRRTAVSAQSECLSYTHNFVDLDPVQRESTRVGHPVLRINFTPTENDRRQSEWFQSVCSQVLKDMGAIDTYTGPRFTGLLSSHDLGTCRMGSDPNSSVTDPNLMVHDTPGLYIFSGAVFPSCPGVNPTLTLWAVCLRAADNLIEELRHQQ